MRRSFFLYKAFFLKGTQSCVNTVNVSSYIITTSYKQSLRQGNEAKCWVVNKRICLKDTIMEFGLETELTKIKI